MTTDEYEIEIRQQIADMQARHRKEISPLVDMLIKIESLKPPKPLYVSREQAIAMGFNIEDKL